MRGIPSLSQSKEAPAPKRARGAHSTSTHGCAAQLSRSPRAGGVPAAACRPGGQPAPTLSRQAHDYPSPSRVNPKISESIRARAPELSGRGTGNSPQSRARPPCPRCGPAATGGPPPPRPCHWAPPRRDSGPGLPCSTASSTDRSAALPSPGSGRPVQGPGCKGLPPPGRDQRLVPVRQPPIRHHGAYKSTSNKSPYKAHSSTAYAQSVHVSAQSSASSRAGPVPSSTTPCAALLRNRAISWRRPRQKDPSARAWRRRQPAWPPPRRRRRSARRPSSSSVCVCVCVCVWDNAHMRRGPLHRPPRARAARTGRRASCPPRRPGDSERSRLGHVTASCRRRGGERLRRGGAAPAIRFRPRLTSAAPIPALPRTNSKPFRPGLGARTLVRAHTHTRSPRSSPSQRIHIPPHSRIRPHTVPATASMLASGAKSRARLALLRPESLRFPFSRKRGGACRAGSTRDMPRAQRRGGGAGGHRAPKRSRASCIASRTCRTAATCIHTHTHTHTRTHTQKSSGGAAWQPPRRPTHDGESESE